jgi:hypothetical protein
MYLVSRAWRVKRKCFRKLGKGLGQIATTMTQSSRLRQGARRETALYSPSQTSYSKGVVERASLLTLSPVSPGAT